MILELILINKQKFSDKLYPGGEKCDSTIIESKSIMSVSDNSTSDLYLNEKDDVFGNSYKETIPTAKKNPSFSGPVPPFRKERSTNLNCGNKTPKSPSFGNITYIPTTINTSTQTEKPTLLTSRRVSSKPKKRPPSHIGISKNSVDTAFTLKEDDENNLLAISNQESYMTNIKVSEVKIAKKVNLLKLPSKEPVKLDIEDKDKPSETDKPKMLKILDEDDNEKEEEVPSSHEKKPLNIKTSNFDEATPNEGKEEEENKLKPNRTSMINNNRMSMFSPNLLSELSGQLNKRASLNVSVNVEEKLQSMSNKKKMEKEDNDNKNMFDVKLRSSDSPVKPRSNDSPMKPKSNDSPMKLKSNDSLAKTNNNQNSMQNLSSSHSELANNSVFKKRATMMNSLDSNEDNESNTSNNMHLKNVKKMDDNKSENSFIESPSLCKPSDFIKNAKNNNTPFNNNITSRSIHSSSGSSDSDKSNKEEEDKSYEQLSVMDKISLLQKNQQQSSESPVKSCPNSAPKSNFLS